MATPIRPKDLPPLVGNLPADSALIADTGTGVFKFTPDALAGMFSTNYATLAAFKAAPISNKTQVLQDPSLEFGTFYWETADAPYTADNINIIKADSTSLAVGAWVRQQASEISANGYTSVQDAIDKTGGSVAYLKAQLGNSAVLQRSFMPFAEIANVPCGDLIPGVISGVNYPVVARRMHANWILVRVKSTALAGATFYPDYYDEFVFRNPNGYAGVAGGWQLVLHRANVGYYRSWFVGPDNPDNMPNNDWALRIGLMSNPYVSSGDLGNWRYRGFGHGGAVNTPANNQIFKNGGGPNLNTVGAWPVGTDQLCTTSLLINQTFNLLVPPADTVEGVKVTYQQSMSADGLRRYVRMDPLVDGVGFQDSYAVLFGLTPFEPNRFKPGGLVTWPVNHDGLGKPDYPNPWNAGQPLIQQAYNTDDPTVVMTVTQEYPGPVRASNGSISPFALNLYFRAGFNDQPDYAKYYAPFASSQEAEPRTAFAFPTVASGVYYESQAVLVTKYRSGGPV